MNEIERIQKELTEEIVSLGDGFEQYAYLIELAALLPPFPAEKKTEDRVVKGCQSHVWLDMRDEDGLFYAEADSDTFIIKGILYLLQRMFNGQPCAEVAAAEITLFAKTELMVTFEADRQKGIGFIIKTIQQFAAAVRNPIYIENDRLFICNLKQPDLEGLEAIRGDQQVYCYEPKFLAELQGTPEEALETIRNMDLYADRQCILGVYVKTDPPALAGLAEFYDFKPSGKVISLGYRFLSKYWGKGIASSCIQALLNYIQTDTRVELVTAHVLPGNKASARCLIKTGFEYLLTKTEDWGFDQPCIADVYTFDC